MSLDDVMNRNRGAQEQYSVDIYYSADHTTYVRTTPTSKETITFPNRVDDAVVNEWLDTGHLTNDSIKRLRQAELAQAMREAAQAGISIPTDARPGTDVPSNPSTGGVSDGDSHTHGSDKPSTGANTIDEGSSNIFDSVKEIDRRFGWGVGLFLLLLLGNQIGAVGAIIGGILQVFAASTQQLGGLIP